MADEPDNIILEHLRAMRKDQSAMRMDIKEVKDAVLSLREDVNGLRGDVLRVERGLASVEVDVDRIKARLDLSNTPDSSS